MNIQTDKMQMIFRKDNEYGTSYSMGMSKKKQDGTYDNAYIPVQFKKGVEFENQTNIYIKKAWLSFYKTKEGKTIFYIFINKYNVVENEEKEDYGNIKTKTNAIDSLDIEITDDDLPF